MLSSDIKLPYVTNPTKIRDYFNKISEVETPEKFTVKFLEDVMMFKSNNDRNLISLLKSMGFLDGNGVPTQSYSDYKISELSKTTMGKGIRHAYNEIYRRNKNFETLDVEPLKSYVKSITRLGDDSSIVPLIVRTLTNLRELADFTHNESPIPTGQEITIQKPISSIMEQSDSKTLFNLNYTISINLPNSSNQETYDMIFESIKKILLSK